MYKAQSHMLACCKPQLATCGGQQVYNGFACASILEQKQSVVSNNRNDNNDDDNNSDDNNSFQLMMS